MTFEANIKELDSIVDQLDSGELDLDRALQLFTQGIELLRAASAELGAAEARAKQLIEEADGVFVTSDLRDS